MVHEDKIYVIAGIINGHIDGWVKWVDEFDPVTGTWTTLTDAPRARDHFMAAVQNGKIYVAGGRKSFYNTTTKKFDFSQTIAEVDVYDIKTGIWSAMANNIPTKRAGAPVGILGGELLVMGGESAQKPAHSQTEALNLSTGTWRKVKDMITPRHATQAIVNNGGVFLAAGSQKQGASEVDAHEAFFFADQKDPAGTPISKSTLEPSATTIDFGAAQVGVTATQTLTLANKGTGLGIVIEKIALTGNAAFSLSEAPSGYMLLRPGAELPLDIVLEQQSGPEKNATLTVYYSGANSPLTIPIVAGDGGTSAPNQPVALINAGGKEYVDAKGQTWIADKYFYNGKGFEPDKPPLIEGTEDEVLYQSERFAKKSAKFGYKIPITEGVYDIYLHFAEIFLTDATDTGKRVFDVSIEGKNIAERL